MVVTMTPKLQNTCFKSNAENILEWFEEGDVLIVDRGFRDLADLLEEYQNQDSYASFHCQISEAAVNRRGQ